MLPERSYRFCGKRTDLPHNLSSNSTSDQPTQIVNRSGMEVNLMSINTSGKHSLYGNLGDGQSVNATYGNFWFATNSDDMVIPINGKCDVYDVINAQSVAVIAFEAV